MHTLNNIAPVSMVRVEGGKFVYMIPKKNDPVKSQSGVGAP